MQSCLHLQVNLTLFGVLCVLMVVVKVCQGQLYSLYNDVNFSFFSENYGHLKELF
jgi:hypothetical protein